MHPTNTNFTDARLFQIGQPPAASAVSESSAPVELVKWMFAKFRGQPLALTTSFGMEGCALIDICSKALREIGLSDPDHGETRLTVAYIDTGFFFPETIKLRDRLIEKYSHLNFVRWATPVSIDQQKKNYGDGLWKNNPNQCCHIRKVVPMVENIGDFGIWITGLRRTQTDQRSDHPVMSWDWRYEILKFCPLASWTRADVWQYVKTNGVPFNSLHLQGYPSIGCIHCTRSVPGSTPESDSRDGRWEGSEKTECGLHYNI